MDTLEQYGGFLGEGYLEATDKLKECRFFLNLMERTTAFDDFRWFTSAFLSAARAVMDWLATSAHHAIPGDGPWEMEEDPQAVRILKKHSGDVSRAKKSGKVYAKDPRDPLLQKLCADRNENAHNGPVWIKPERVDDPCEFKFGGDDTPVIDFAKGVIDRLTDIQHELRPDLNETTGA